MTKHDDDRFTTPLYTVSQAAQYLDVPRPTLATWADGYVRIGQSGRRVVGQPVITTLGKTRQGYPRLPFIGLAEAYVLSAFRKAGVPLQRIRPSLEWLKREIGPHALASQNLYTDGAEVLYNFAQHDQEDSETQAAVMRLLVPRSQQYVFNEVVEKYLQQITFASDGFAEVIRLPHYRSADVVVDPHRGFGHPIFEHSGVRVEDVLGPLRAGEALEDVAEDYGVPVNELRALSLTV